MEEGEFFAIETFGSTGKGYVREVSEACSRGATQLFRSAQLFSTMIPVPRHSYLTPNQNSAQPHKMAHAQASNV